MNGLAASLPSKLILSIKATECVNRCRHCWAQGHPPLRPMDFVRIKEVADLFRSEAAGTGFDCVRVMLGDDIWSRLDAVSLWRYQRDLNDGLVEKVILTNGFLFAQHNQYSEIIAAAKAEGLSKAVMSIHGLADVHDWFVGRQGAFADITLAARRLIEGGIKVRWNVFLHKPNVSHVNQLIDELRSPTIAGSLYLNVTLPSYMPNRRLAEYEPFRLIVDDLERLCIEPAADLEMPNFLVEGEVTRAVLSGDYDLTAMEREYATYRRQGTYVPVTCDRNLDIFEGPHGNYERYHGNLDTDGIGTVMERIISYQPARLPAPAELAARFGDIESTKLHNDDVSIGRKWLGDYWRQKASDIPRGIDDTFYAMA